MKRLKFAVLAVLSSIAVFLLPAQTRAATIGDDVTITPTVEFAVSEIAPAPMTAPTLILLDTPTLFEVEATPEVVVAGRTRPFGLASNDISYNLSGSIPVLGLPVSAPYAKKGGGEPGPWTARH